MADEQLVDENGEVYDVVPDTDGWDALGKFFSSAGNSIAQGLGTYYAQLQKAPAINTGVGSGSATTTPNTTENDPLGNLWGGIKNYLLGTPQAQALIQSGAQSAAQQQAGAWITNPVTWVIAGGGLLVLIFILARRK
jgi:hypothetical protein